MYVLGTASSLHVHVDHQMMGIGGDNSWENDVVHPEFIVNAGRGTTFHYEVVLSPLGSREDPAEKARTPIIGSS